MGKSYWSKLVILLATIGVLVLTTVLIALPVSANPGLTVSNAVIVGNVIPGQTLIWSSVVSIGASDPATVITVQVEGMTQGSDGTMETLSSSQDTGSYSARQFITLDQSSFPLAPGGSQKVTATIQVPQNAGDGQRFAMINIQTQATPGNGVNTISAVNVPIYLTITGSQMINTGKITGITTGDITNSQPIDIKTEFQNTGNYHFKVEGEVVVTNDQGVTLETVPIPLTTSNILPGVSRDIEAVFTPSGSLAPGTYTISSKIMLADGTLLDQSTSTFTVQKPYVPPPALGNVSLAPSGASTLKNTDGTISIYFPTGAAAIPVDISLNNIAAVQLPVAPTGFTLTGSSFQVNGLTGLLAKDATVTLKYTADDLSKANGKASSLNLMRWDVGSNQWVVLQTKVNASAMTLTATSKQMGIWAVASGIVKSSGINWTIIGIPIAVVIIIGVVGTLLISRRKPRGKSVKNK